MAVTATTQIKATIKPTLLIQGSTEQALEGETVKFLITTTQQPTSNRLMVKWSLSETGTNFLDRTRHPLGTTTDELNFTQAAVGSTGFHELELRLKVQSDGSLTNGIDDPDGKITVTLEEDPNGMYLIADRPHNSALKTIHDNDTPVLSVLENTADPVLAGESVEFILELDQRPAANLAIRYTPTNDDTGGNFLDTTIAAAGVTRTSPELTFTMSGNPPKYRAILEVPTAD